MPIFVDLHSPVAGIFPLQLCQAQLDLSGVRSPDPEDAALTQFRDMLAWDITQVEPDPGPWGLAWCGRPWSARK